MALQKIQFLDHEKINKAKWDACITRSVNGNIYGFSWYLDIIHPGWAALVTEDYLTVMPLPLKSKWGVAYCYQPFFAQQLGVYSVKLLTPDVVLGFISKIPASIRLVDYHLNSYSYPGHNYKSIQFRDNYQLDLIPDYQKISTGYNTNTKRNINKARKHGLSVSSGVNHEEIIALFRANKGKDVQKWQEDHYRLLSRLFYQAMYHGAGVTYGAYNKQNELVSGAFYMKDKSKIIFLFSGTSEEGRDSAALALLIDFVINHYSGSKLVLDFEGSNNPNLARYYAGFGAEKTHYYRLRLNRLSPFAKVLLSVYHKLLKGKAAV